MLSHGPFGDVLALSHAQSVNHETCIGNMMCWNEDGIGQYRGMII